MAEKDEKLLEAIRKGNSERVRAELKGVLGFGGADPNAIGEEGRSALELAADPWSLQSGEVVADLVRAGADFAERNERGNTVLHEAALHGDAKAVGDLAGLCAGEIMGRDASGWAALHVAAARQWGEGEIGGMLKALLEAGADVNSTTHGPRIVAASSGETLNVSEGTTALMLAAGVSGSLEMTERLLREGARATDRNAMGSSALHFAARAGAEKIVEALLKAGAEPNAADENGETALMEAAERGREKVVAALLEAGADPKAKSADGKTAADLAWKGEY